MISARAINNSTVTLMANNNKDMTLAELLSSKEWADYFRSLSGAVNFEFNVYSEDGALLMVTGKNRFCDYINSAGLDSLSCPDSCNKLMFESLPLNKPVIYKCKAKLINFALPVERFNEKAFIVGRGGFASYEDLLEFLKIVKDNNLPPIPVAMPLDFPGDDYVNSLSHYVYLTVNRMMISVEEKYELEEKLLRVTSLFDNQTFRTLSKNPELMYRYIIDTIEFVFGHTSAVLMLLDEESSAYKTVYSTVKDKEAARDFHLDAEHPFIYEMRSTREALFIEDPEEITNAIPLKEIESSYFFPIFINGILEGMIGILNKKFSRSDMKIMNAFRDYVQLNLENRDLRLKVNKTRKADEILSSFVDLSDVIAPVLDIKSLLNILLQKSIQLLNAEQGSLMLLDRDTSELVVEAKKSVDNIVQENMRLKEGEGIAGMVLENGGPILVENIEEDPRTRQRNRPRYKTKSFVSVPIKIEGRVSGVLNISDKIKGEVFGESDLNLIESFVTNIAIAIERSLLYKQTEEFKKLSITDPLTGIYNRRHLNSRLSEEITRYNRYKHPFSFLMFDLDRFKEYNDTYGHLAGDNLLKALATTIEESLRTIDIAARFGGDEFVTIFPQTPKVDAIQITNRLKEKVDKALSEHHDEMTLTVSMGLATYPDDASSIMELIEKTDQALYLAKKGGGNRVVFL